MQPLKHFDLNDSAVEWDRYRTYFKTTTAGMVTHFITGEMCIRAPGNWSSGLNGFYSDRNIIVASTANESFGRINQKYGIQLADPVTREPITDAWLRTAADGSAKGQRLLIDLDHQMAVALATPDRIASTVPRHILRCGGVYYPSETAEPQGGAITVSRPHKVTPEEKARATELEAASSAWWSMSGWADIYEKNHGYLTDRMLGELSNTPPSREPSRNVFRSSSEAMRTPMTWDDIEGKTFADLSGLSRLRLHRHPVKFNRDVEEVSSLHVYHDRNT